jgi:hypothetical protein
MDASDGRRRKRKRDTTPDAIGLALKRELLMAVTRGDPDPDEFEPWLLRVIGHPERSEGAELRRFATQPGAARAMARAILDEWRLACASPSFQAWLDRGAPSADR